ncbi:hypothetical protein E2C01_027109 [Portunus trituberculatus]|uniref:Uncharacterized protein n=1 Tax=Portunus trituberculatus TaxID=210409 RepID=A0A5B7EKA1_PORTR|nr:hypothetical protein [Portunus trituberculatus]
MIYAPTALSGLEMGLVDSCPEATTLFKVLILTPVLFLQSLHRIPQSEDASGVLPLPAGGT